MYLQVCAKTLYYKISVHFNFLVSILNSCFKRPCIKRPSCTTCLSEIMAFFVPSAAISVTGELHTSSFIFHFRLFNIKLSLIAWNGSLSELAAVLVPVRRCQCRRAAPVTVPWFQWLVSHTLHLPLSISDIDVGRQPSQITFPAVSVWFRLSVLCTAIDFSYLHRSD